VTLQDRRLGWRKMPLRNGILLMEHPESLPEHYADRKVGTL
jgi:hypothetical protein